MSIFSFRRHLYNRTHTQEVEIATLQVVFFFVVPIVLLYFKIIPIEGRIPVLLIFSLLIYGVIRKEKWTPRDLGISLKTLRPALPVYLITTVVALGGIVLFAQVVDATPTSYFWLKPHFLGLFLVVSFFQEFAFRSFLMPVLSRIFPDTITVIIVNALLFTAMHIIYPFLIVGLPVAFFGGLLFAILYHRYPNLLLVSLSHAVLNFALVYFGLFVISN